jgi:hypothetical protein
MAGSPQNEVVIGRVGWDYLRVAVSNRWSSNWFDADVEIHCGAWSGKYTATFENGELRGFAAELRKLYQTLSGRISFQQKSEKFLTVTCEGDGRGHISLSGVAEQNGPEGPRLFFGLRLDQTELPQIAEALETIDPPPPG